MREAVSIIIPCFNPGRWLALALASVRAQEPLADGSSWVGEVVLVDDGSTDGAVEAAAAAWPTQGPALHVIRQVNAGVAVARNRGVDAARCEWIAFLDADDAWHPEKLARQMAALQAHPGVAMACSGWQVWRAPQTPAAPQALADPQPLADPPPLPLPPPVRPTPRALYAELLEDCSVWTSTVLMRRSLFLSLGGFEPGRAARSHRS
jgi:glycosyltransferase involved in cell wall biosynthesis